jgi:type II secretory pathway pseudopilin PulG
MPPPTFARIAGRIAARIAGAVHAGRGGREAGFTLAEMTVTLIVVVEVALAALLLFDASGKLGKAEMQVSDMQQALRIGQYEVARMVRMAGRGELPVTNNPAGVLSANLFAGTSLSVRNNVPADSAVIAGAAPTDPPSPITNPRVVTGTDVLTVRGVFTTPLYQINYGAAGTFVYNPVTGAGTVTISSTSPTGVPQPFDHYNAPDSLADALGLGGFNQPRPEALILVSALDDTIYGVAQLDPTNSTITGPAPTQAGQYTAQTATLAFTTTNVGNVPLSANGTFPTNLKSVAYVGIVEEYRYYVREVHANPSDPTTETNPRLSRARFYAGSDNPWNNELTNLYQDIADGVMDLQIALGFDLNGDKIVTDANSGTDEILFNSPADDATSAPWSPLPTPFPPLFYVRVDVLARTNRHDVQYRAPIIVSIEDHVYNANPSNPWDPNGPRELNMRRRWSQTIVGMRNRI